MRSAEVYPRVFQAGKKSSFRILGTGDKVSVRIVYKNTGAVLYAESAEHISEISTLLPYAGEYYIFISSNGSADSRVSVYGVSERLAGLMPLRGDMHVHTLYSDGAQSPRDMVIKGRRLGLDYMSVTDHDSYFPSLEANRFAQSSGLDILVFEGEEVTVPTGGHVLSLGASSAVHLKDTDAETLKKMIDAEANEIDETSLEQGLDAYTYGGLKLVIKQIKERGGFAVLCHPFWMVERTGFYHLPRPMLYQAVKDRLPDALEIPGDTLPQDNLLGLSYYYNHTDRSIPIMSNSDTHATEHTFGHRWQIVFVTEKTKEAVLTAVSSFMSVACEKHGDNINVYGDLELTEYAYFLIREYFPQKNRLAGTEAEVYASGLLTSDIKTSAKNYVSSFFVF